MSLKSKDAKMTKTRMSDVSSRIHMFETGLYSDVVFKVEGHLIKAHKLTLSRSAVFSAMFEEIEDRWEDFDKDGENRAIIVLENEEIHSFNIFLKYLYSNEFDSSVEIDEGLKVLKLAHMYQVRSLIANCCAHLKSNINVENCVSIHMNTKIYDNLDLGQTSLDFITRNIRGVLLSDGFLEIDEPSFSQVLQSDNLEVVREIELFKGILRWKNGNGYSSAIAIKSLLELIRYDIMNTKDFIECVIPAKVLSDKLIIEILIIHYNRDQNKIKEVLSTKP